MKLSSKEIKTLQEAQKIIDRILDADAQGTLFDGSESGLSANRRPPRFVPPTQQEVRDHFIEKGYSAWAADSMHNYYSEQNWCDGRGKPVRSWKGKARMWMTHENKISPSQGRGGNVKDIKL